MFGKFDFPDEHSLFPSFLNFNLFFLQEDAKKELDHDEDKRNPEYIPKKGSFYEHDTRTMDG